MPARGSCIEYLKSVVAESVQQLRFLSQNETASRFEPTDGPVAIGLILKRVKQPGCRTPTGWSAFPLSGAVAKW